MEKINFQKYTIKEQVLGREYYPWQIYADQVIKDFDIQNDRYWITDKNGKPRIVVTNYKSMIFRHASNNLEYLKGKVENCKEKFGADGLKGKGHYLISLFRKKKPWD